VANVVKTGRVRGQVPDVRKSLKNPDTAEEFLEESLAFDQPDAQDSWIKSATALIGNVPEE